MNNSTITNRMFDGRTSPMLAFLESAGVDLSTPEGTAKLQSTGYMDLTVEWWQEGGVTKVSVCHYGEQNGDLMRDPEVVFRFSKDLPQELPEYYRNDYLGIEQYAIFWQEGKMMFYPRLLKDLQSFARTWARNLKEQGHRLAQEVVA